MSGPVDITSTLHFRTFLGSHTYTIVDFYATWCPPCKQVAPIYSAQASKHSVPGALSFLKVNIDDQPELAQQFNIQSIPTFILFKNGKPEEEVKGANVPLLKKIIDRAAAEVQEAKAKANTQETATPETKVDAKADTKVEEKVEAEEKTVSGSYGMTGGNNWKQSLN